MSTPIPLKSGVAKSTFVTNLDLFSFETIFSACLESLRSAETIILISPLVSVGGTDALKKSTGTFSSRKTLIISFMTPTAFIASWVKTMLKNMDFRPA